MDRIEAAFFDLLQSPQQMIVVGVAFAAFFLFVGIGSMVRDRNPAAARIARQGVSRSALREDRGLLLRPDQDPSGLMKGFIPTDRAQRSALQRKLAQAGYAGPDALRAFTMVRILLGILLPGILLGLIFLNQMTDVILPLNIDTVISQIDMMQIALLLVTLTAAGYFLPMLWLQDKVNQRRQRIEIAFPNALDLVQISVEAGLGFDAAMTRVGNELVTVSPDIAFEFLSVQRQVQAGRARDAALHDMAERTGVETVRSFANVVQQSMQFGTSMGEALEAYAKEMREIRETKAQEMANKLPVKMSAVMASLMLPALITLTVGPTVIRYMRYFGG